MKAHPEKRLENSDERAPLFDAQDGKILATGDMFRGPSTGFISDLDLNNPGLKLPSEDIEQLLR